MTDFERVSEEIRAALLKDGTRMGDVCRALELGKTPAEIAAELGTQTPNFVNKYKRFARAIETGSLPLAPTMIRECGTAMRGFLNRNLELLSPETIAILEDRISALKSIRIDPEAEESEDLRIRQRTQRAERQAVPGIYVYTLPHYRKHPVEPAVDESLAHRTLMKVGMSDSDVIKRFRHQERNTSLPEDPELLRIYTGGSEMLALEQRMHRLLRAADHRQNTGRASGTEWFLTSLKFLDAIAEDMGLKIYLTIDDAIEETGD